MSLGTQKKFFILAGLAGEFDCLLMDEPSNAIDLESIDIITQYLAQIAQNKVIIIATHDKSLIEKLPGKIHNLRNSSLGEYVQESSPQI